MATLRTIILSFLLAVGLVFFAGAYSWGYFSQGADHYIALVLASPFIISSNFGAGTISYVVAFAIYFFICLALVLLVRGAKSLLGRINFGGHPR